MAKKKKVKIVDFYIGFKFTKGMKGVKSHTSSFPRRMMCSYGSHTLLSVRNGYVKISSLAFKSDKSALHRVFSFL